MINIHKAVLSESKIVTQLFIKMWSDNNFDELKLDFENIITSEESIIFLACDNDQYVAVAQCGLRHDYVEGTDSSPVGYLEGIYVEEEYRKLGISKMLCDKCEKWAQEKGCKEFASDCELNNTNSIKFHLGMGFTEVNRLICFNKKLNSNHNVDVSLLSQEQNSINETTSILKYKNENLIGKCGFYCGSCPTYIKGDCLGCRKAHKKGDCYTFDCVDLKGIEYCGLCSDFPCDKLINSEKSTVLDKKWLEWKLSQK